MGSKHPIIIYSNPGTDKFKILEDNKGGGGTIFVDPKKKK